MRKMGFENMRSGNSRYQNLVLALIIVCFYLTYTWWYLSTQNYELLKQMDDMGEQLRVCSDERVSCINRKNNMDSQLRETESRMADMKMNELKSLDMIKKEKSDMIELSKTAEKAKQELQYCQTKLESLEKLDKSKSTILETMRIEKDTISEQLAEAKEKVNQLESTLKGFKQTTAANKSKPTSDVLAKLVTVSPIPKPKGIEDQDINLQDLQQEVQNIANDPIQDGNHAIDDPQDQIDNAAIEDMDNQEHFKKT